MKDAKESKVATACYLIYRTAMRVGDEKDEDEEILLVQLILEKNT